jgi:enoyl-CoA hydratase
MNAPETPQTAQVVERKEGAIGWLVLSNIAKLNAITYDMWAAIPGVLDSFAQDDAVRLVVLTGAGERAFAQTGKCPHPKQKRSSGEALEHYNRALAAATHALLDFPKPTLAKVRGVCVGGGLALALDCDLRFCSDDALFRMPAGRLGLGYEFEGIKRMVQVLGAANACDLFFSARKFGAAAALQIGLVSRVFPSAEFDQGFAEYCAMVAENAPLTLAAAKRAILEIGKDPAARDLARVQAMYQACFASADYAEGRRAFMEKRTPKFQGR